MEGGDNSPSSGILKQPGVAARGANKDARGLHAHNLRARPVRLHKRVTDAHGIGANGAACRAQQDAVENALN
jgi:hypothetical protein